MDLLLGTTLNYDHIKILLRCLLLTCKTKFIFSELQASQCMQAIYTHTKDALIELLSSYS